MKLHDLRPDKGATKPRKRVGRGISAGQGKTAGRGTKGQGARSGGVKGAYFEGGQLPLVRRLPFKRGFTNIFRVEYQEVNLESLARVFSDGATVTPQTLAEKGLIKKADEPVVILGDGDLSAKLTVSAHRFSKSAQEKIEAAGGSVQTLELLVSGARATVKKLPKDQLDKLRAQQEQ
ncbi:MAG: 50S ribosomal protein L15 [Anaerolineae bacterium]|nr:50S ribosomal protein L15 [Anaerolineae bacterium]